MNNLKKTLIAACSLVLVSVGGTAIADSSNFAGPYIGLTASGVGIAISGVSNSAADDTTGSSDEAQVGKVSAVVGGEVGYALPLSDALLLDVGVAFYSGETRINHDSDDGDISRQVAFKVDDLVTAYIAPTLVLSDTSSLYVKLGLTEADIGVEGDITTPSNLSGTTWGIGTRTQLESGLFIRTEAGYTDYNGIHAHGTGTTIASTSSYSAEPTIAYGLVSMGFRF